MLLHLLLEPYLTHVAPTESQNLTYKEAHISNGANRNFCSKIFFLWEWWFDL